MNDLNTFIRINKSDMVADLTEIVSQSKHLINGNPDCYIEPGTDTPSIDIRLCIDLTPDRRGWIFRTGLSDYDQYHSEYCGASCVTLDTDVNELLEELVKQLD